MVKTQIQLPDALYREVKRVAEEREISLAEVLRRGAEYITRIYQPLGKDPERWTLPGPFLLDMREDPFADPEWRYKVNAASTEDKIACEPSAEYVVSRKKSQP